MYEEYLATAKLLAEEASSLIRKGFTLNIDVEVKHDGTPLTETDTLVNSLVIKKIRDLYPDHSILGEEESSGNADSRFVWVCDPIDGTIPYVHGLNISTFSLALVEDGKPVVGIVSDPFQGLHFSASMGCGTYLNGKKVCVNKKTPIKNVVIGLDGPEYFGDIVRALLKRNSFPAVFQSFAYGAKQVASGHFSGAIYGWNKSWDCAAVKILVEESGGKATNFEGNDQRYDQKSDGFICSNGLIHDELMEIVSEDLKTQSSKVKKQIKSSKLQQK